jgi:hypothetical protein
MKNNIKYITKKNKGKKLLKTYRKKAIEEEKKMENETIHLLLNSHGQLITTNTILQMYVEAYPVQHQVEYNTSRSIKKVGLDTTAFMSTIKRYREFQGRGKKIKDTKTCQ